MKVPPTTLSVKQYKFALYMRQMRWSTSTYHDPKIRATAQGVVYAGIDKVIAAVLRGVPFVEVEYDN